ncbi:T9SS type A sorting domain-containing protein [Ferruginibacter profundus]
MKKIFTLLCVAISVHVFAQSPVSWQTKIGGTDTEYANAVDSSTDGNMFAAGFIRSRTGDFVMQYPGPDILSPDAWIVKYNKFGNIVWQKCFGGTNPDEFFDVKATPDGGAIATGRSGSTDGNITNNKGGEDIVVAKYDANGNLEWHQNYGTTLLDGGRSITLMADGSYVLGCYSNGNNKDLVGGKGGRDIWMIQISATGTIMRTKNFGGSSEDDVFDVKKYGNDNWVLTGSTGSINGDVTGNHGATDAWVLKLDASWVLIKQKCFGSTGQDIGNGMVVLPGGFAMAARVNANNGDVTGLKGAYDGWIVKTDADLNIVWAKTFGGTGNDMFYALTLTQDGNLLAAGETSSTDGDIISNAGVSDAWLVKTDPSNGNIIWSKTFGDAKGDKANDILVWGNDDYLFAGQFSYIVPNSATSHAQLWIATSKILPSAGPLPIKIISFTGVHSHDGNVLLWQSADEINSKEYIVERSLDGIAFTAIGSVAAAGNSSSTKAYQFTDRQPAAKCWYRLVMVEINGNEELSTIISVSFKDNQAKIKLYPAVSNTSVTIEMVAAKNESCNIIITDATGRLVATQTKNMARGINKLQVNIGNLANGMYYVSVLKEGSKEPAVFIKQ